MGWVKVSYTQQGWHYNSSLSPCLLRLLLTSLSLFLTHQDQQQQCNVFCTRFSSSKNCSLIYIRLDTRKTTKYECNFRFKIHNNRENTDEYKWSMKKPTFFVCYIIVMNIHLSDAENSFKNDGIISILWKITEYQVNILWPVQCSGQVRYDYYCDVITESLCYTQDLCLGDLGSALILISINYQTKRTKQIRAQWKSFIKRKKE